MRKVRNTPVLCLALALCLVTVCTAQVKFDSLSAWRLNRELASDKFEGRKSGLPGGEHAAEWIASKFNEWGLEPAGANGTYFAPFPLLVTQDLAPTRLELINGRKGKIIYSLGDDYVLLTNSGSGKTEAEVVFVGYGINEPSKGRDDYTGVDVGGKIVLVLVGAPSKGDWSEERSRGYKIRKAGEKGAAGLLLVSGDRPVRGGAIHQEDYQPQLPSVWIGSKIISDVFYNTGLDYGAVKSRLDAAPQSFKTGKVMYIEANVVKREGGTSKNVIGMIRGVDQKLSGTYIVVGAHMDHCGKDSEGSIYPGADDNGSGTATVMELARAMMANHVKPKRSVLFITFAGEEQGLLGSQAFVNSPTVDREKIVFMLNLDMVGRGNGNIAIGGMENYPQEWRLIESLIPDSLRKHMGRFRVGENSDHYPFEDKGIPAFFLVTSGDHPEYHQTSDTGDKIQPFVLGVAGTVAYDILLYLSNYEGNLSDKDRYYKYEYHRAHVANFGDCVKTQTSGGGQSREMSDSQMVLRTKELLANGVDLYVCPLNNAKTEGLESSLSEYARLSRLIEKNGDVAGLAKSSAEVSSITGSQRLAVSYCVRGVGGLFQKPEMLFALDGLGVRFVSTSDDDANSLFSSKVVGEVGRKFLDEAGKVSIILDLRLTDTQRVEGIVEALGKPAIVHFSLDEEVNETNAYADVLLAKKGILVVDCGNQKITEEDIGKVEKLVKKFTPNNIVLNLGSEDQIAQVIRKLESMGIKPEAERKMFGQNIIDLL